MTSLQGSLSIERMCVRAQVSRAGYYRWLGAEAPGEEEVEVRAMMQQIVLEHRRRYGYRRVSRELRRRGLMVNHKRVARLMREDNLLAIQPKAWTRTTDAEHDHPVYLNLAARMQLSGINQLWIADITYIRLKTEFVYLAVVLDAFSRKVVGWALEPRMTAALTVAALEQAIAVRQPLAGLVHHSDRGIQYACREYVAVLEANGILASMSRPANPYDNASCESFMRTLKREQIHAGCYRDLDHLRAQVEQFIERYYNRIRLHSALGYVPPVEFEQAAAAAGTNTCGAASMSFFRHGEIYPPDGQTQTGSKPASSLPALIGTDESPAGYSLAGCSPAEPASASPAGYDRQPEGIANNSDFQQTAGVP
jgi:putative transposase